MNNYQQPLQERGLSLNDLDTFADLEWERQVMEGGRQSVHNRKSPVNLSSKIEDYLRSHF